MCAADEVNGTTSLFEVPTKHTPGVLLTLMSKTTSMLRKIHSLNILSEYGLDAMCLSLAFFQTGVTCLFTYNG